MFPEKDAGSTRFTNDPRGGAAGIFVSTPYPVLRIRPQGETNEAFPPQINAISPPGAAARPLSRKIAKRASLSNTPLHWFAPFRQAGRSTRFCRISASTCRLPSANPSLSRTSRVLPAASVSAGRPCRA